MKQITFCIPSKNNLRYLKNSIRSIQQNSKYDNDIIVYVDADNDGTIIWLQENNIKYIVNPDTNPKGIAYAYNRCIEAATTKIVCMFHADMYMAPEFDSSILMLMSDKTVVSGTRIEPPLHPAGLEKIVKDFGMYPEDFKEQEFLDFCVATRLANYGKVTQGIFAPWAVYKDDVMSIGMHDEQFHSYHEDSDIFNRFILNGFEIKQTWLALVYHLTCRGGQFQDGIEKITANEDFHLMKRNAARNYIRKWGSFVKNNEYQYPILSHKYNVAFVVDNCNLILLEHLEPWCDRIYVDEVFKVIGRYWDYVEVEQSNTQFDLSKRVLCKSHNDPHGENDIVVKFDAEQFTQQSFNIIQQLSDIITQSGDVGTFELDCFTIEINNMVLHDSELFI